ncbi:hypothetical protein [Nocardia sp. CC227C]|uniref:SLAC1 family transporter n=1 Tax=Nocardia sp. CC227C TaxID=3044562 RepID=UPI00278C3D32|nr:hypothetical protein [Nocardia sp. CC227C]
MAVAEVVRPRPRHDIRRWATVFPLGMTTVATLTGGAVLGLEPLHTVGRVLCAVAVIAWLVTFTGLLADRLGSSARSPSVRVTRWPGSSRYRGDVMLS